MKRTGTTAEVASQARRNIAHDIGESPPLAEGLRGKRGTGEWKTEDEFRALLRESMEGKPTRQLLANARKGVYGQDKLWEMRL